MGGEADGRFFDMVTLDTRLSWESGREKERAVNESEWKRKGGGAVGQS